MNHSPAKADRATVPNFGTESEEAKSCDDQKDMVEENLIRAMRDGRVKRGTAQRLAREARRSRNVTIRMAEADLDLARKQEEAKGLRLPNLHQVRSA